MIPLTSLEVDSLLWRGHFDLSEKPFVAVSLTRAVVRVFDDGEHVARKTVEGRLRFQGDLCGLPWQIKEPSVHTTRARVSHERAPKFTLKCPRGWSWPFPRLLTE